jgi:DNA-binding NarL/FixJ family response regulator
MTKAKILIADDHSMIRDGLKSLLSQTRDFIVVDEAVNGTEAISKYNALQPDLVILDISMPELNGMDAAREILSKNPGAKIIILSMYDDEEYISKCMEVGVMGYVFKNETRNELDHAVRTVLKGENYFSNEVQHVIFKKYSSTVTTKKKKEPEIKLTSREIEIVKLIAEGLTSQQMAEKLFISPRTIETHRANLMKKTTARNSMELIRKIQKLGLL